jgi:hypothetical protein
MLPLLLGCSISIGSGQTQPPRSGHLPANRAILGAALAKWKEAIPFERTGNWIPAAICLENAARIAAQAPKDELTGDDLLFIAQMQTAYAEARYQAISAQPGEQTWRAYLQAADDAKAAIDNAGRALQRGQPGASALILRAKIELMSCNYEKAGRAAQFAEELYPAGRSEYAKFRAFVAKAQNNGTGPCNANRPSQYARWKPYLQDLDQIFELLKTVQTAVKTFE